LGQSQAGDLRAQISDVAASGAAAGGAFKESSAGLNETVMPGLVPGIHVLLSFCY
jgi:hypothetical protein